MQMVKRERVPPETALTVMVATVPVRARMLAKASSFCFAE